MARRSRKLGLKIVRLLLLIVAFGCSMEKKDSRSFTDSIDQYKKVPLPNNLINDSLLPHRGVYSNDFQEYYFVTSSKGFENFDIQVIKLENGVWSEPSKAWFNSEYDDHGLSFSPDGKSLFFSSTRPVEKEGISSTWHIWRSDYQNDTWSEPRFIDIPNLREMLFSHPSVDPEGTLYFHASNPDYSNMNVYFSKLVNGVYQEATKIEFEGIENGTCTPYISNDGSYLFFAAIEQSLPVYYVKKEEGQWSSPIILSNEINEGSQANPVITSDSKKLLLAKESSNSESWHIEEVALNTILQKQ